MTPRIFIDTPLHSGACVTLLDQQSHYIRNVLRLSENSTVLLFNGADGEWHATIDTITKKGTFLTCTSQTKAQSIVKPLTLMCALIKPQRFEWLIEKATELGISHIQPLITDHCHIRKLNIERAKAQAIEASEQSERLSIPIICEPINLRQAVHDYPENIIFADEARDQKSSVRTTLTSIEVRSILVGPEGGFSAAERAYLYSRQNIYPVHLGTNILRAETAGIAMIATIQAICGEWAI